MHYRIVQQREGVSASPPAGGIGGVSSVSSPCVAGIFVQPVKSPHVLRVADGFEDSHILPAGEDVGSIVLGIHADNALDHVFLLVQLGQRELCGQRVHEISPDKGFVLYLRDMADGDTAEVYDIEVPF